MSTQLEVRRGWRRRTALEMKERIQPRLAEFGVSRVNSVTWLDRLGYPVYQAVRPLSRNLSVSQGKGRTNEQAWISAAMESIELHCAQRPVLKYQAVPADRLPLPYPVDSLTLERHSLWHAGLPIDWTEGVTLSTGELVPVPYEAVAVDFTSGDRWTPPTFRPSSNGLASGATVDEASMAAAFELVERHNLQTASGTGHRWTQYLTIAIDDPGQLGLTGSLDEPIRVDVMTIPADLPLPTMAVRVWSSDLPYWFWGSATDFDPCSAFLAAFGEAVQSRLTMIAAARDDVRVPPMAVPEGRRGPDLPLSELLDHLGQQPSAHWSFEETVDRIEALADWPVIRCVLREDSDFAVVKLLTPGLSADRYPHG